jgi:hypothetical protein
MEVEYITKFKDYRDLPFSKEIQDELFNRHEHLGTISHILHGELINDGEVIYKEKDVLILLQMLKTELNK